MKYVLIIAAIVLAIIAVYELAGMALFAWVLSQYVIL